MYIMVPIRFKEGGNGICIRPQKTQPTAQKSKLLNHTRKYSKQLELVLPWIWFVGGIFSYILSMMLFFFFNNYSHKLACLKVSCSFLVELTMIKTFCCNFLISFTLLNFSCLILFYRCHKINHSIK